SGGGAGLRSIPRHTRVAAAAGGGRAGARRGAGDARSGGAGAGARAAGPRTGAGAAAAGTRTAEAGREAAGDADTAPAGTGAGTRAYERPRSGPALAGWRQSEGASGRRGISLPGLPRQHRAHAAQLLPLERFSEPRGGGGV